MGLRAGNAITYRATVQTTIYQKPASGTVLDLYPQSHFFAEGDLRQSTFRYELTTNKDAATPSASRNRHARSWTDVRLGISRLLSRHQHPGNATPTRSTSAPASTARRRCTSRWPTRSRAMSAGRSTASQDHSRLQQQRPGRDRRRSISSPTRSTNFMRMDWDGATGAGLHLRYNFSGCPPSITGLPHDLLPAWISPLRSTATAMG